MKREYYYAKDFFTNGIDLYVCKHKKSPIHSTALHRHDFAELAYTYSGKARHIVNNVTYPVERGTLIFINYNSEHEIIVDETVEQVDILLSPRFISNELAGTDNYYPHYIHSIFSALHTFRLNYLYIYYTF